MQEDVVRALSPRRFETFLRASGFDRRRALALCLWDAQVGAAFHPLLQAVELSLRNRLAEDLAGLYGPTWWQSAAFAHVVGPSRQLDMIAVSRRIGRRFDDVDADQLVSGLSFGFWVALLRPATAPRLWPAGLSPDGSAGLASFYASLFPEARSVLQLRNRIAHHEPLIRMDLLNAHRRCRLLLAALSPAMEAFVRPSSAVPRLMREKP